MGWVEMSERELRRAEVLASVFAGRLTMTAAAEARMAVIQCSASEPGTKRRGPPA